MGEDRIHSDLEGAVFVHCERFPLRTLQSRLSIFSREEPAGSGTACAEAERRLQSCGSQMELAEKFERGMTLWHEPAADEDVLLDDDYWITFPRFLLYSRQCCTGTVPGRAGDG